MIGFELPKDRPIDGTSFTATFNIEEDPWEVYNLISKPEYKGKVAELTQKYKNYRRDIENDPILKNKNINPEK